MTGSCFCNWGGKIQNVLCPFFFSNVTSFSFAICIWININILSNEGKNFIWLNIDVYSYANGKGETESVTSHVWKQNGHSTFWMLPPQLLRLHVPSNIVSSIVENFYWMYRVVTVIFAFLLYFGFVELQCIPYNFKIIGIPKSCMYKKLINPMAYGTRRLNIAFTRALVQSLSSVEPLKFFTQLNIVLWSIVIFSSYI